MDLKRFEEIIKQLFTVELLEEFYDDYGFIHASNQSLKLATQLTFHLN